MFKETIDGQTHSENDGCGESAHNKSSLNPSIITTEENDGIAHNVPFILVPKAGIVGRIAQR